MIIFFKYFIDDNILDEWSTWYQDLIEDHQSTFTYISACLSHLITTFNKALSVLWVLVPFRLFASYLVLLLLNFDEDWLVTTETHVDLFQIIFQIFLYSSSTTSTTHPQCSWGFSLPSGYLLYIWWCYCCDCSWVELYLWTCWLLTCDLISVGVHKEVLGVSCLFSS